MLTYTIPTVVGVMAIAAAIVLRTRAEAKRLRPAAVLKSAPSRRVRGVLGIAAGIILALNLSACGESTTNEVDPAAAEKSETADEVDDEDGETGDLVQVTGKEHFRNVTSEGRVLVDFYADWCGPCKAMAPILKDLAKTHSDTLTVAKVNVDEHRELAEEHGVRGIPYLVLYQDGEAVDNSTGYLGKKELANWLAESEEG